MNQKLEQLDSDIMDQVKQELAKKLATTNALDINAREIAQEVYKTVSSDIADEFAEIKKVIEALRQEIRDTKEEIAEIRTEVDNIQQYARRNALIFRGIPEEAEEDTDNLVLDIIRKNLSLNISINEISRSHRLGRPQKPQPGQPTKPRGIIVKFISYRARAAVFRVKKMLEGSGITVTEHLTSTRQALLKEAVGKYGQHQVWTIDGRIMAVVDGTKKVLKA